MEYNIDDFRFRNRLHKTDKARMQLVEDQIHMSATHEAKMTNGYILLHVKARPWWIPNVVYEWVLGKILVINRFTKESNYK